MYHVLFVVIVSLLSMVTGGIVRENQEILKSYQDIIPGKNMEAENTYDASVRAFFRNDNVNELQEELIKVTAQIAELKNFMNNQITLTNKLKSDINESVHLISRQNELTFKHTELETCIQKLQKQFSSLESETNHRKLETSELRKNISAVDKKLTFIKIKSDKSELKTETEMLKETVNKLTAEIEQLKKFQDDLKNKTFELETETIQQRVSISNLENKISEIKSENCELKRDIFKRNQVAPELEHTVHGIQIIKENCTKQDSGHIIPGLREEISEDFKSRNWIKTVDILKKHLCSTSENYKQLEKIKPSFDLPLLAAANGYTDIIQVLLRNGLPVNGMVGNRCMLHEAAGYGLYDTVNFLIENGADIEVKDEVQSTPIHYAATRHHINVTRFFIEHGADIDAPNIYGNTVLHRVVTERDTEIVKLLLSKGAQVNVVQKYSGETPLHWAAEYGDLNIMKLLIDYGSYINAKDKEYGWTPLNKAVNKNQVAAVKFLVDNGCDKSITDIFGMTALTYAIENDYTEIINILSE